MGRERFRGLGRTSFFLALILTGAKGLGFLREVLLTKNFGATAETDAFYLVFALVVLVSSLVMTGAPKVLVPRYLGRCTDDSEQPALAFLTAATLFMTALGCLIAAALILGADPLVGILAPAFEPEQRELAANLVRLLAWVVPVCALAGALMSLARARSHFFLVQIASLGMNVGTILALVLWSDSMGVRAAAVGLVGGLAVSAALMSLYPFLQRLRPALDGPALRGALPAVGLVGLLALLSSHGGYLAVLVDRYFAARLPEGQFSCMGYSLRLLIVPQQILYGSMAVALLPALADRVTAGEHQEVERMVGRALRMLMVMLVPMLCGIAVLGQPIVEVAYGRGAFDERAIQLTATLMLCQLPAVLTETIRLPLATVFFSHGRTLTAISFGLVRVALMLVLYPFVWEPWGAYGLALAMGVADIITVGVMLVGARSILGLKLPGLPWFGLRLGLASALTCAFALGAWTVASTQLGLDGTLEQLLGLGVVAAVSCLLGGVLARAMGLKEASELVALLASIARRKRGAAPGAGR